MEDKEIVKATLDFIAKDFRLQKSTQIVSSDVASNLAEIRRQLVGKIEHLLDFDFEQLMSILYRVDVDEQKVKEALRDHSPNETALILTELVMERQLLKVKTRLQEKVSRPA